MKGFKEHNPIAVTVYFLAVAGIAMFNMNVVIFTSLLVGSLILFFIYNRTKSAKTHLFSVLFFITMALLNPIFSHNGVTVLFVMNNNPVTLEAILYGCFAATVIIAVLYCFRCFSQIMTSDKLLYIFGALSPKTALILSMSLRYVPLFGGQIKKINKAQKALGAYKDDNILDTLKTGLRISSITITWAIENGITTADSMTARGYGSGKRSRFSIFRFRAGDFLLIGIISLLTAVTLFGIKDMKYVYYPAIVPPKTTLLGVVGYIAYALLVLLPVIYHIKEAVLWKYLRSKI